MINVVFKNGKSLQIAGVALSAIVGVLLNLVLPGKETGYGNGAMFDDSEIKNNQNHGDVA